MNNSKAIISGGWSALTTVDDFDVGVRKSNGVTKAEHISKNVVKSLFVESLIDQLCKLLEKDSTKRQKLYQKICKKLYKMQLVEDTYNIEEFAPLRGFYQQALLEVITTPDSRLHPIPSLKFGSSRYSAEYEEIDFIASGGFGKVFKAKNRLDQNIYAIKKIPLKYHSIKMFEKKLNEVKTLAKLNHPNIIQYKSAWLEPLPDIHPSAASSENTICGSNESDIIMFEYNESYSSDSSSHSNEKGQLALCKYNGNSFQSKKPKICALLYVTMQLCDQTLGEWLQNRNLVSDSVDVLLAFYIFREAALGVQYIHSCNIVHHDIKPRNIFLSYDLKLVEVGDFGLSCLHGHDHTLCPLGDGQYGTPLYAAPEQLKGHCNFGSDMFSLGLIFIELLTKFSTEMERAKILSRARSGELPSSIPLEFTPIIKDLLSHSSSKRPTATQLIASLDNLNFSKSNDTIIRKINHDKNDDISTSMEYADCFVNQDKDLLIQEKEKEIIELKRLLAQKEGEIKHLQQKMLRSSF